MALHAAVDFTATYITGGLSRLPQETSRFIEEIVVIAFVVSIAVLTRKIYKKNVDTPPCL